MRDYRSYHQRALARIRRRKGVEVEFRHDGTAEHNPLTATFGNAAPVRVPGLALEMPGNPEEYAELELTALSPATIIFVPETYGAGVGVGWWVVWAGKRRTVRASNPIRPDGVVLAVKVVVV